MHGQTERKPRPAFGSPPRIFFYALIAATCCKVWLGSDSVLPVANAQIPDSGNQRRLIIQEIRKTNVLLQQIHDTLANGTIKVHSGGADNARATEKAAKVR